MEPSNLTLFWAGAVALSIFVYVILDGFDLGVGVLFGTTNEDTMRVQMMNAIAPFWDGNETWLVIIGASLFAAFPVVYAVFLSAFYLPVLLLLFGLIFRGVAFEFRNRAGGMRWFWDWGLFLVRGCGVCSGRGRWRDDARRSGVNNQYCRRRFRLAASVFGADRDRAWCLVMLLLGAGWLVLQERGITARLGIRPHTLACRRGIHRFGPCVPCFHHGRRRRDCSKQSARPSVGTCVPDSRRCGADRRFCRRTSAA